MKTAHVRLNSAGNALLGALAAVTVMGVISTGMVSSYDGYLRQSRIAYLRSAMTSVDNRIRYLAMQPGAYTCTDGPDSCTINTPFFYPVLHTILPGVPAPPAGTPGGCTPGQCGFVLDPDPDQPDVALKRPFQVRTIDGKRTGVFLYLLRYQGTDFQLRPGGWNVDPNDSPARQLGMVIPREVLQAEDFDCAATNGGATPIFEGFSDQGRPICRGFTPCPTGQYAASVDFRTGTVRCVNLARGATRIDCARLGQYKINRVDWNNGALDRSDAACSELQVPEMNGTYAASAVTPTTPPPTPPPTTPTTSGTWQLTAQRVPNTPSICPNRFSENLPCSPRGSTCTTIRGELISGGIYWVEYTCQ